MQVFTYFCLLPLVLAENTHTYYWRDYRGTIPHDAYGFQSLYVAQVPFHGALPATLYPDKREAVTECFGKKLVMTQGIKILCDTNLDSFFWEHVRADILTEEKLNDCVIGGIEGNGTVYIGRVFHEGEWKIGKIFPPSSPYKGLKVWDHKGDQYSTNDFEVLRSKFSPFTSS